MTLTADEAIKAIEELKRNSPRGGATPLFLETPDGYCEIRSIGHSIDDDEPVGLIETEPAAFT
jgi:hypothetical protein